MKILEFNQLEKFKIFVDLPDPTDWLFIGFDNKADMLLYAIVYDFPVNGVEDFSRSLSRLNREIVKVAVNPFSVCQDIIDNLKRSRNDVDHSCSYICFYNNYGIEEIFYIGVVYPD